MLSEEKQQRLNNRINELKSCQTPEELSYAVWTKKLEAATHDQSCYRNPFVEWIKCYKSKQKPQWNYKTPKELAEAIWKPKLQIDAEDDIWFPALRNTLIEWINNYCA